MDLGSLVAYSYDWDIFWNSIFAPDRLIIQGVPLTVAIAVASQIISKIL